MSYLALNDLTWIHELMIFLSLSCCVLSVSIFQVLDAIKIFLLIYDIVHWELAFFLYARIVRNELVCMLLCMLVCLCVCVHL